MVAGRQSDDSLFDASIATFEDDAGAYDQKDAAGFITIVDRIKDMIAVGGFKVFPSQIEEILLTRPGIREVLVIGMPDDYLGEVPKAFVTLEEDCTDTAEVLKQWTNEHVGKHERLIAVEIRDELPKTMIGKLDRKALRAEVL